MKKKAAGDGSCYCSPSSSSSAASSSCIGRSSSVITGNNNVIQGNNNHSVVVHLKKNKPNKRGGGRKPKRNTPNSAGEDAFVKPRSSIYRGVTRHRWTGRYEAHLWDKTTFNNINKKKGRQIYLGAYENEEDAARTHDLAAIKYWGTVATLNFPVEFYAKEMEEMSKLSKEEYLASLRRRSSGFSRGVSKYRGVARHHHNGRWEARIGRVSGNKYLYLGTYNTQEEAAAAYDMAAIEFRGPNAVTNFHISNYSDKLKKIDIIHPELETEEHKELVRPTNEETIISPTEDHHQKDGKEEVIQLPKTDHPSSRMESSGGTQGMMLVMDPIEEQDHIWSLCLDPSFNMVTTLPDIIPIDEGSSSMGLGWLDAKGFEDNIECIFDDGLGCDGKQLVRDEMSGTGGLKMETAGLFGVNEDVLSTSGSSSSLSTMASIL